MTPLLFTERLIIRPLTYEQLVKYARCDNSLEAELKVSVSTRSISAELREALENTIIPNVADDSRDFLFSTIWTAISRADNVIVCDLCIYGEPNDEGEVEVGYGTYDEHQNKGFMTEMLGGIIAWISAQEKVKSIIASTEKDNAASSKVLKKNHFILCGESDTLLNWRLDL